MILSLSLSNVALVRSEQIDFDGGFNCLLGQSGAGKSVIMAALAFLLGGKADKNLIRSGQHTMRVDGVFCKFSREVCQILSDLGIEFDENSSGAVAGKTEVDGEGYGEGVGTTGFCTNFGGDSSGSYSGSYSANFGEAFFEGELILSRTLSADGRSTIRANGVPITLKNLQAIAEHLADFCGQHESVGLLNPANHLAILDRFAGQKVEQKKQEVAALCKKLSSVRERISSLGGSEAAREREKDLLSFQIGEIDSAQLQVGEEETLRERYDFFTSAEKIFERVSECVDKLEGGRENAISLLHEAKSAISGLNFKDIEDARTRLENAYYEVKDVAEELCAVRENTDFDERELERIDERLEEYKLLHKKYGTTTEQVLQFADDARARLDEIEKSAQILQDLGAKEREILDALERECEALSGLRKEAAKDFEAKICRELEDLEMKGTRFVVDFSRGEFSQKGFDVVKFMFSANVGQEVRDLHKTASGGELSRLLLAFKNVMRFESCQVLVFDEVDAGISGRTAGRLAEKLQNISKFSQIICITHTPVVAAKADRFLLVKKEVLGGETQSHVLPLEGEDVPREIARLIDGAKDVSATAIEHAKKLLEEKTQKS